MTYLLEVKDGSKPPVTPKTPVQGRESARATFTLDRCSVVSPQVFAGDLIAYYTEIGGRGAGRWIRAHVIRAEGGRVHALDEDNDVVVLDRWERTRRPPKLKPAVLRSWFRAMAFYPRKPEQLRLAQ